MGARLGPAGERVRVWPPVVTFDARTQQLTANLSGCITNLDPVTQLLRMAEGDRITWLQQHLWPYVGRLLAATARGVRSVSVIVRTPQAVAVALRPSAE